jgi:hypothetical protein
MSFIVWGDRVQEHMETSYTFIQDDHSSVQQEPEDDEFHDEPDQKARDKAISEFLNRGAGSARLQWAE